MFRDHFLCSGTPHPLLCKMSIPTCAVHGNIITRTYIHGIRNASCGLPACLPHRGLLRVRKDYTYTYNFGATYATEATCRHARSPLPTVPTVHIKIKALQFTSKSDYCILLCLAPCPANSFLHSPPPLLSLRRAARAVARGPSHEPVVAIRIGVA